MRLILLVAFLLSAAASAAQAAPVCVILSNDTTKVLSVQPPCNGHSSTIDTTDSRWVAYVANQTLNNNTSTAQATRQGALTGGITLSCTASQTSNLSGTYAVDQDFLNYLMDMQAGNFPNNYVTGQPVIDTSNVLHTFANPAAFATFYQIVGAYWINLKVYYMQVQSGLSPSLPANTSSAC